MRDWKYHPSYLAWTIYPRSPINFYQILLSDNEAQKAVMEFCDKLCDLMICGNTTVMI